MTTAARYLARRVGRLDVTTGIRRVRVVHELDGILHQVHPMQLTGAGHALWGRWRAHPMYSDADLLLGLDAGGILPTVAVALASGLPYRLAWKVDLDVRHKHRFTEPHARRMHVFTYGNLAGLRVLIVDDEVTTGRTIGNLITVLRDAAAEIAGIACLVEDTTGRGRSLLAGLGVPLCALTTL